MNCRIVHIDLDAFFVSVEQALNPSLKGKPVVVGGRPDRRGVVASASYEARKFGLHAGMPLATAVRLCPHAIFIEGSFHKYREASEKFMAILADFSPFLEPVSLDEAYLDVTGFESLHGSIRQMVQAMKKRIQDEVGITASAGIAGNKTVAKIAAELSKPDGLLEITEGEERAFLSPLTIDMLPGVGKKAQVVLKGLGINTIGQLANTPVDILKSRFGVYGEVIHRHANGIGNSKIETPGQAKSISRETTFAKDTRERNFLKATLRYLSERVGAELREQDQRARCVTLKLRYADFTTITRRHTLRESSNNDDTIFNTGLKLLNTALIRDRQPVRLIGIGVSHFAEAEKQLDMFGSSTERLERLDKVVDRIRVKYGFNAIQTGRTLPLKEIFPEDERDYTLHTPSLSR